MENLDPRFQPRSDSGTRTPVGLYPVPDRLRAVGCVHCGRPMGVSTWEYLNGFLVVCPHCRGYHGKPWGIARTLVAGFFFNAASFFFTLRPQQAIAAIVAFGAISWLLVTLAAANETNDAYMIAAVGTIVLGPVLVNAFALVRHQMRLDAAPPANGGNRAI